MKNSIAEYLLRSAKTHPEKIAIRDEQGEVTFAELLAAVRSVASYLCRKVGANAKKTIAVYMDKRWECVACFLGIAYSGNVYSPMDIQSPDDRIQRIFNVLMPEIVISFSSLPYRQPCQQIAFEEMVEQAHDENILHKARTSIIDTDPLYIMFTSGTTGLPKGVTINHRGVIDYTEWLHDTFSFDEHTVFGEQAPFYFDNSILDIYSTLKNAATMIIVPKHKFLFPNQLMSFLAEQKVNTIFWVPSALIGVANSGALENVSALPPLRQVLFCGEVMPNKQLNMWRKAYGKALFANLYGPTEITDVCSYYIVDRPFGDDEALPIGRACRNTELMILDKNDRLITEVGKIGELCVRGTCLSMGYYNDPERTAKVFVQNPHNAAYEEKIYRTGDLVRFNVHGELDYVCRKDFQIKHQGHRIELGEIETVVSALNGIRQSCALYDDTQKEIILFCAVDDGIVDKEIFRWLKAKLPHYMLPARICSLDLLPLNDNGKIDRPRLRSMM